MHQNSSHFFIDEMEKCFAVEEKHRWGKQGFHIFDTVKIFN